MPHLVIVEIKHKTHFHLGYRPELDGLRGIAILLVFLHHAGIPVINGAHIGVDIFFVLSGFLITALLWREYERYGQISLKNFYIRRFLRLMPALALLLAVFTLYTLATKSGPALIKSVEAIVYAAFYFSDFAIAFGNAQLGGLSHTWSLAIEEHFYILYPLALVLLLGKRGTRWKIVTLVCVLIALIGIHRFFLWGPSPAEATRLYYSFDTRADGLLMGCMLGLMAASGRLPVVKWVLALAAVLALMFAAVFADWDSRLYAYGLPLINLSAALVLAYVLTSPPRWLTNRGLVWIGTISYGLYLWHNLIFILVRERVTASPSGVLLLGGVVSIACAALSYYLLERPCLKLKRRFTTPLPPVKSFDPPAFDLQVRSS